MKGVNCQRWDGNCSQKEKNGKGVVGGGGAAGSQRQTSAAFSHLGVRNRVQHVRESSFVAIWRLKVKSLPPPSDKKLSRASAMLAMKKCNFLCGLLLVNLQAATLINTVQTNVSQHCHASINHSDISFLTSASPLAQSQTPREMERRGGRGGEGMRGGGNH